MFEELMKLKIDVSEYLDDHDELWLVNTQREIIESIKKRDLIRAASYCEVVSVYYLNFALENFDRFDSNLLRWREFSLGMEYLRVSAIIEKKSGMAEEPTYFSIAKAIAAVFYGFICNRDDFVSVFFPLIKFQEKLFPSEISIIERLIKDTLSDSLGGGDYSFYDFFIRGESTQEKLFECISEHVKISKYTKIKMPCFVSPFNVIPLEILFCMQYSQLKLGNELDGFLLKVEACKYQSDSIIEMIEVEL